jgi:hypothetical protein
MRCCYAPGSDGDLSSVLVSNKENTKCTISAGEGTIAEHFTNQIKEDDVDGTARTREAGNLKGMKYLRELGLRPRIRFKLITKKWGVKVWT